MLESEREIVMEERRARIDNDIPGMMDEELGALVFKAHSYRWPIIGWMKDIQGIRREDCLEFFRTYYAPNNATLYICGDIDPARTLALVRRYYGKIRRGPPPPPVPDAEPEQRGERRAIVRHPAQASAAMIAWKAPAARDPAVFVLDVIQYAMGVGEAARLTRELVYRKNLAVSVGFDWGWRIDPGVLVVFAELHPGVAAARAEELIYEELRRLAREGLSLGELAKAKNMLRAHMLHELATNGGRANLFGTFEMLLGDWREAERAPARYEAITNEQVKEAAARFFVPEHRSAVVLDPLPVQPEVAA